MNYSLSQLKSIQLLTTEKLIPVLLKFPIINPDTGKIVAFRTSNNTYLLPHHVEFTFPNTLILEQKYQLYHLSDLPWLESLIQQKTQPKFKPVFTKIGIYLGKVYNFEISFNSMELVNLHLGYNFLNIYHFHKKIISKSQINSISKTKIIVQDTLIPLTAHLQPSSI